MPCGAALEIGWIPVRRTVSRDEDVHAEDHVEVQARLLPILPEADQGAILREELERRGWFRRDDGTLAKTFGEAEATLAPGSDTIRLVTRRSTAVSASATESGTVREEDVAAQDEIGERAARAAEARVAVAADAARRQLEQRNIDVLLRVQGELQAEVGEVVNVTTRRSLEQRAAQLGSVESVREGRDAEGGYELKIVVRT